MKNTNKIEWKIVNEYTEHAIDASGNVLGKIYRTKDVDGDYHWMYSYCDINFAARDRDNAKYRLESQIKEGK